MNVMKVTDEVHVNFLIPVRTKYLCTSVLNFPVHEFKQWERIRYAMMFEVSSSSNASDAMGSETPHVSVSNS